MFWIGHGVGVLAISKQFEWTNGDISITHYLRQNYMNLLPLVISHGFSFVFNFITGGERNRTSLGKLFTQPYSRVVVLHLTILFGAFVSIFLGQSIGILIVLVLAKIVVDVFYHQKEHRLYGLREPSYKPAGGINVSVNRSQIKNWIRWVLVTILAINLIVFASALWTIIKAFMSR